MIFLLGLVLAVTAVHAQPKTDFRIEDVIYARKFGTALTMDVFEPAKPNGIGILWMVSGFFGPRISIRQRTQPLLERGYTVFAVVHGSQPNTPSRNRTRHPPRRSLRAPITAKYGIDLIISASPVAAPADISP